MKLLSSHAHAYLDGELLGELLHDFEAHLAANPALAVALTVEQQFRTRLRTQARQMVAPASLRGKVQAALAAETPARSVWSGWLGWWLTPQPTRPLAGLLYTLVWVIILGGVLWWSNLPRQPNALIKLADRHTIYFADAPVFDVTGSALSISAWFQSRLPFPVKPPVIADWSLAGARLGELNEQGTAHLLYERADGRRISLTFFSPDDDDFPARQEIRLGGQPFFVGSNGQQSVILWRSGPAGYALVGDTTLFPAPLQPLALNLRAQLP